ncbi:MAG: hypothetical protein K9M07_03270 [Simkaniaceae bacterium]|nr:hypothetical protein [Simkaniaceae bacterium]MCF7852244.1 hypothetical protein [Simkaniaceae bacterium]
MGRFRFGSAIWASIIASAAMSAFMIYFNMNILLEYGKIAGFQDTPGYIVGGAIQLVVCIFFGLIYALIFDPLFRRIPGFLSGIIYGLIPFILALTMMGKFEALIRTVFHNPKSTQMEQPVPLPMGQEKPVMPQSGEPQMPPSQYQPQSSQEYQPQQRSVQPGEAYQPENPDMAPPDESSEPSNNSPTAARVGDPINFRLVGQTPAFPKYESDNRDTDVNQNEMQQMPDESMQNQDMMGQTQTKSPTSTLPHWLWLLFSYLIYGFFLGLLYFPSKRKEHYGE